MIGLNMIATYPVGGGYEAEIRTHIELCIRRYRYSGSFLRYVFRTLEYSGRGIRPGNALFVPPPHTAVGDCISDLERFIHEDIGGLPVLIKAALTHVQFETIHPFLDGNGRIGRLLITFLLCSASILREPLLYLSLYFKQNREEYYRLLYTVRKEGDWESWILFFLALFDEDRKKVQKGGRRAGSALHVHDVFKIRPIITLKEAAHRADLSFPATGTAMDLLVEGGIAREITGKRRNRAFVYDRYLAILGEGT
jgi:Fic family protein